MKKVLMMVLVLAVAAPCVLAQNKLVNNKTIERRLAEFIVPKTTEDSIISKLTTEELKATKAFLVSLDNLRKYFAEQKENEVMLNLQHIEGFYRGFAADFAANEDIDRAFEAKNPQLVKLLAKEMQRPIKVGWAENKTIVLGNYIADHLPEAYGVWFHSEPADNLDSFNRDILAPSNK